MSEYIKSFEISKDLANKGYLLNATTIFYEAAGIYSNKIISNSSLKVRDILYKFSTSKHKNKEYLLSNFCFSFIRKGSLNRNNKNFDKVLSSKFDDDIKKYLNSKPNYPKIKALYKQLDSFRNNLAHTNSGEIIKNPYEKLNKLLCKFSIIIKS